MSDPESQKPENLNVFCRLFVNSYLLCFYNVIAYIDYIY